MKKILLSLIATLAFTFTVNTLSAQERNPMKRDTAKQDTPKRDKILVSPGSDTSITDTIKRQTPITPREPSPPNPTIPMTPRNPTEPMVR